MRRKSAYENKRRNLKILFETAFKFQVLQKYAFLVNFFHSFPIHVSSSRGTLLVNGLMFYLEITESVQFDEYLAGAQLTSVGPVWHQCHTNYIEFVNQLVQVK